MLNFGSPEDNGAGINEANMKNLFRIENKYSVLGTNNEAETELGLILCKSLWKNTKDKFGQKAKKRNGHDFLSR